MQQKMTYGIHDADFIYKAAVFFYSAFTEWYSHIKQSVYVYENAPSPNM